MKWSASKRWHIWRRRAGSTPWDHRAASTLKSSALLVLQLNMTSVRLPFPLEILRFPEFAIPSLAMADASAFSRLSTLIIANTSATTVSMPPAATEARNFLIHLMSWQKSQCSFTDQITSRDYSSALDLAGMRISLWKR